jgi:hypothetical protein
MTGAFVARTARATASAPSGNVGGMDESGDCATARQSAAVAQAVSTNRRSMPQFRIATV